MPKETTIILWDIPDRASDSPNYGLYIVNTSTHTYEDIVYRQAL
jgi:hypothetical protein